MERERERQKEQQAGGVAGIGRGRSRLPVEQGAWCGARSQDSEIMTWAEGRCLTHWATQMPLLCLIFFLRERERKRERERERVRARGGGSGWGLGRETILSRFHAQYRARCETQSHDLEIMIWAKIKSQMLNEHLSIWAIQAPCSFAFCSSKSLFVTELFVCASQGTALQSPLCVLSRKTRMVSHHSLLLARHWLGQRSSPFYKSLLHFLFHTAPLCPK